MTTSSTSHQQQHTPTYPDDDTFRLAFIRGINAAMAGDREAMERATADIHAVTAPYIE